MLGTIGIEEFTEFFATVHDGSVPFSWQRRLAAYVLDNERWPRVLDLPTGSGKTAVLDIAIYALATKPDSFPRRIIFVVDRRIVVDQVYERAEQILNCLRTSEVSTLVNMRNSLSRLSNSDEIFGLSAMRGGIPLDNEWTSRPDQPWIVVSTVDQFGSRLLFRAYGTSPKMRPIHAGLAGNDCVVILDEVHLSTPFAETLENIQSFPRGPLPRRFFTVEMSATPTRRHHDRFELDPVLDLKENSDLKKRMESKKVAELVRVPNREELQVQVLKLIKNIERSNKNLPPSASIRTIGVVVNRVKSAREIFSYINDSDFSVFLLTGRMRPIDRQETLNTLRPMLQIDSEDKAQTLIVVVATQALEVGADFSFDAMITECAPLDSLRQRFGRLDRRGNAFERTGSPSRAWIIGIRSIVESNKPDPIYGDAIRHTWVEFNKRVDTNGLISVRPIDLREFGAESLAPKTNAPLLLRSYMDALVQTNPEPLVQPSIDWFLHGINTNYQADVSVLWRWDRTSNALRLVPPRQAEFLQIPIGAAKEWLSDRREVDIADVNSRSQLELTEFESTSNSRNWCRWEGFDQGVNDNISINDIKPGDILLLDPSFGGITNGVWDPTSNQVVNDLGDRAQEIYGYKLTLRLDPRLSYINSPPRPSDEEKELSSVSQRLNEWFDSLVLDFESCPEWLSKTIDGLRNQCVLVVIEGEKTINQSTDKSTDSYYVITKRSSNSAVPLVDPSEFDGSDEACTITGTRIKLCKHLKGVANLASQFATNLGFPAEIVEDLHLAGLLHDLGKVDPRFQLWLVGGDPIEKEKTVLEPLAKSLSRRLVSRSYPKGMRHEFTSVALIDSNADVLKSAHDPELVRYLVGTHHGFARPLPSIVVDTNSQDISCKVGDHSMKTTSDLSDTTLAFEMAHRFWHLVDIYGYHGLAWLESILRLADHQQSANEAYFK